MYHIFGYNHDIPSERWSRSVSDAEINKCLAELCDEYCEILVLSGVNTMHEKKWIAANTASTSEADTLKLIELVKKLVQDLHEYFRRRSGGCYNKLNLISGIVKGGDIVW